MCEFSKLVLFTFFLYIFILTSGNSPGYPPAGATGGYVGVGLVPTKTWRCWPSRFMVGPRDILPYTTADPPAAAVSGIS